MPPELGSRVKAVKGRQVCCCELLVSDMEDVSLKHVDSNMGDNVVLEIVTVGIPKNPKDFEQRAVPVGHPRFLPYSSSAPVDEIVKKHNRMNPK